MPVGTYIYIYILFLARLGAQPRSSDRYPVPYTGAGTRNSPGTTRTAVTVSSRTACPRDRPPYHPSAQVIVGHYCRTTVVYGVSAESRLHKTEINFIYFSKLCTLSCVHNRFSCPGPKAPGVCDGEKSRAGTNRHVRLFYDYRSRPFINNNLAGLRAVYNDESGVFIPREIFVCM